MADLRTLLTLMADRRTVLILMADIRTVVGSLINKYFVCRQ